MLQENLIRMYEQSFKEHRELPALTDYFKGEQFSYFEMAKEIAKVHLLFEECKIERGDRIALIGRNNPRWCIAYLATMTYGAVIVPILQEFNPNDVQHIINHSGSVLLFAGDQFWETIDEDAIENIRAAFSLTDFSCIYEAKGGSITDFQKNIMRHYRKAYPRGFTTDNISYPEVPNEDMVLLNYTSGTTGFSKGVMLSCNNLTGNVVLGIRTNLHYPGSRALSFLPLAHAYGCAFDFLLPMATGSHVTLLGRMPAPKVLVEALGEVKPNLICCVPMIMEKIYRKQIKPNLEKGVVRIALKVPLLDSTILATIRNKMIATFGGNFTQVLVGGAPLNEEVEEFLIKIKFPFTVGYGMTECAPLISYTPYTDFVPRSCGMVLDGLMTAKIESPDPVNVPGEICVKGEHVMTGYYKNPKATEEMFDSDGWMRTGDIGTMLPDGTLFIRGRNKSMILGSNGQNIYPEEIESKLNNMYCVMESLVLEREGKLVALVCPDYEQMDSDGISHSEAQNIMDENLKVLNTLVAPFEKVTSISLYPNEFAKTPKRSIKRYLYTV